VYTQNNPCFQYKHTQTAQDLK